MQDFRDKGKKKKGLLRYRFARLQDEKNMSSDNNGKANSTDYNDESQQTRIPYGISHFWNQIVTGLPLGDLETQNSDPLEDPVVILGKVYNSKPDYEVVIQSQIWLTYRYGFEPIARAPDGPSPLSFAHSVLLNRSVFSNFHSLVDTEHFTNDIGWGCMIRTSQSLLANCYLRLLKSDIGGGDPAQIIQMFQDNSKSPYSIHNFIQVATELPLKVKPGEWFGPNAASVSIKKLCDRNSESAPPLKVLISESCDLYSSQIKDLLAKSSVSLLILLPVRLGIDKINPYYHKSLKQLLSVPQSVGIAGGKPSSSFYFLGYRGDELIYLNPHHPQPYGVESTDLASYHTLNYLFLSINNLDPSMLIGILITNIDDYNNFMKLCTEEQNKIVHFHQSEGMSRDSLEKQRKNSVYANSSNELLDDDYVELLKEVDDFVDLGDMQLSSFNEEFNSGQEPVEVPSSQELEYPLNQEPVEVSHDQESVEHPLNQEPVEVPVNTIPRSHDSVSAEQSELNTLGVLVDAEKNASLAPGGA